MPSNRLAVPRGPTLLPGAVAVPPAPQAGHGFSVCALCHGPARPGARYCWSCAAVQAQLRGARFPVAPLFLFRLGTGAHASLVGYKAAPSRAARGRRRRDLSATLRTFLAGHAACLLGGAAAARGVLVPVPSTAGGRPSWRGAHPLVACCRAAALSASTDRSTPGQAPRWHVYDLLRPGDEPPARLRASRRGFAPAAGAGLVGDLPVVVVDDVFASGTRALSAAAALADAGMDVRAVVPIGRLVRPEHNAATAAFWRELGGTPATAGRCCRCPRAVACTWSPPRAGATPVAASVLPLPRRQAVSFGAKRL